MNKPRTIEGRWRVDGEGAQEVFGVLTFDPNTGLHLSIRTPQSLTAQSFLKAVVNRPSVPRVIVGTDENGHQVTLLGCISGKWSVKSGMHYYSIRAQIAILNYAGHSWDEAKFQHAAVVFTHFNGWMNRSVLKMHASTRSDLSFEVPHFDVLEFAVTPDFKVRIEAGHAMAFQPDDARIQLVHRVYFSFAQPVTLKAIHDDYVHPFLRMLTLLTGEQMFIEEFVLLNLDPFQPCKIENLRRFEVLFPQQGAGDAHSFVPGAQMVTNHQELASIFDEVLKRWFALHQSLRPVLDLYFAVVSNWVLTDETRFLLLAQAWEVYHARSDRFSTSEIPPAEHRKRLREILEATPVAHRGWLQKKLDFSNDKILAKRIDELMSLCPSEAARITTQVIDFAVKVRHTRNYLTHYGEESQTKAASGLELRRIAFALLEMLEIFLLMDLGITGKPVERIVVRNTSRSYAPEI